MSKQSSSNYQDDYSFHYEISIRNEYTRFACMFYVFTLLAFLTTIFLFISANNSYYHESESIQRRFIPYSILGILTFTLFLIFFLGSIVYSVKLIRQTRLKQKSTTPPLSPRLIDNSPRIKKPKSSQSFVMNTDESYYTSTKAIAQQNSRTINISSPPCQTDV